MRSDSIADTAVGPDSQFHVIYDIATTLKLRRRHFV